MCLSKHLQTDGVRNFHILITPTNKTGILSSAAAALFKPHTLLYWNDSIGRNSYLEKTHRPNLILLESQISLAALIQVSRPQTYAKRSFRVVAHWNILLKELCPKKSKSRISLRTPRLPNSSQLTVDGCPTQAQASECVNGQHASCCYPS
jgi:hypothetical protein